MNRNFANLSTTRPHATNSDDGDIIDLGAMAGAIWRGKWFILFVTILFILMGGYYVFKGATPIYRATSVVMLKTQKEQVVDFQGVIAGLSGTSSEIASETEVLRSRGLVGKVADRLNLVNDPEFNAQLRTPSLFARLKALISPPKPPADPARVHDAVVTALLDHITVRNVPNSLVFQIVVDTESPEKSAEIADALVDSYIDDQIEMKFMAMEQATAWLTRRVTELQVELERSEAEVKAFNVSTDLVSPEALAGLERQLKDVRDRVASTQATAQSLSERGRALASAKTRAEKTELADDLQLDRLNRQVLENPEMVTAFDARFNQIVSKIESDTSRAENQLQALQASAAELQKQIEQQSADLIELQQLTREAEASRLLYEYFLSRLKETSAQQGIQQADSRILSDAVIPNGAASPKKALVLAICIVLGLMIGSALVLLREARNSSFRTARELEDHTGYTVFGQIPLMPAKSRRGTLDYLVAKPTSAAAEAIRNLRTSILLSNLDHPPKVILSTSALPGEGKTTNSIALANNLIGTGKKVLLIEGDIRRNMFSQYFDVAERKGIVSILSKSSSFEDAIVKDDVLGADLILGEKTGVNAADLFSSEAFHDFIKKARQMYDFIIIDTPPVLIVPDARIIAQVADAVLFSVKWDSTSKAQIDDALHMFESVNQKVTGLVLSQVSPKGMKRYGYGGYNYGYGGKYYNN